MTTADLDRAIAALVDLEPRIRSHEDRCGLQNDLEEREAARQARRMLKPLRQHMETWAARRTLRAETAKAL